MKKDIIYAKGFFCEKPRENAPDFIIARVSVKVPDAVAFLNAHANASGYVNMDMLQGNNGPYLKLDEWKPEARQSAPAPSPSSALADEFPPEEELSPSDIPF